MRLSFQLIISINTIIDSIKKMVNILSPHIIYIPKFIFIFNRKKVICSSFSDLHPHLGCYRQIRKLQKLKDHSMKYDKV